MATTAPAYCVEQARLGLTLERTSFIADAGSIKRNAIGTLCHSDAILVICSTTPVLEHFIEPDTFGECLLSLDQPTSAYVWMMVSPSYIIRCSILRPSRTVSLINPHDGRSRCHNKTSTDRSTSRYNEPLVQELRRFE